MLKKINRLDARFRLPRPLVFTTPLFTLRVTQNTLSYNRYGFVVSKKVDKRAVVRNRVKRQLRACIEHALYDIKSGYDMLFFINREAVEKTTEAVDVVLRNLLRKEKFLS